MNQDSIGKFIKDLREKNNMTQEELAKKMYVSRSNLSDIENGKTMLSPEKACILASIFDLSIVDIYAGEKVNSNDKELVNKTIDTISINMKRKYKKIFLGMLIVIVLLVLSFLSYYFFYSYNSVKFYKVSGESDNFFTNNGMLIVSKENIYFSLNINSRNDDKIKYISLRYRDNSKDELIQQVSDNYFYIIDYYNYNEFFDYETIVKGKGKYYVEVEHEDKKEIIDLNVFKEYENKSLIFKKNIPISDGTKAEPREVIITDKILKEFNYDDENNTYAKVKKEKNSVVYIIFFVDANMLTVVEQKDDNEETYNYYFDDSSLSYMSDADLISIDKDEKDPSKKEKYDEFYRKYIYEYFEKK